MGCVDGNGHFRLDRSVMKAERSRAGHIVIDCSNFESRWTLSAFHILRENKYNTQYIVHDINYRTYTIKYLIKITP